MRGAVSGIRKVMSLVGYNLYMIRYKKKPATGYLDIAQTREAMGGYGRHGSWGGASRASHSLPTFFSTISSLSKIIMNNNNLIIIIIT